MRSVRMIVPACVFLVAAGASAQVTKLQEFNQDGVLPSADPDIKYLSASGTSLPETQVYSVAGGLLIQHVYPINANPGYQYPDVLVSQGTLSPAFPLILEARLSIQDIQGEYGAFFQAFEFREAHQGRGCH